MKKCILLLVLILHSSCYSQLINCRPKICIIDYNYHNDAIPNADKTAIINSKPDILIDNTPGGYYQAGCLPQYYTPLGIEVYSYIAGGYEGSSHPATESGLNENLARVDAIFNDHATGVFLDEVTAFPNSIQKNYLMTIHNECQMKGLKLIFNPGQTNFDPWLMDYCDYLMSDELYDGTRAPTASESLFLDRLLVVATGVTNALLASAITTGAHANGFGFSYTCLEYINLPAWLPTYINTISQLPPNPPIISQSGNALQSNYLNGNQWYEAIQGAIVGATGSTFIPTTLGTYYVINIQMGCSTNSSNSITISSLSTDFFDIPSSGFVLYPNPSNTILAIKSSSGESIDELTLMDSSGKIVETQKDSNNLFVGNLSDGIYVLKIASDGKVYKSKFIKK